MFRNVGAALAGIVTAVLVYTLIREASDILYAAPAELDFSDVESVHRYHAQLPFGAYLMMFAKPVVATFAGTMVACLIGTVNPVIFGVTIGGIVLAYAVSFFIAVPHPLWLVISTSIGIVLSTLLAMRLAPPAVAASEEIESRESDSGQDPG